MLKHKLNRVATKLCCFAAALFFTSVLFSCKSAEVVPEKEPSPVDVLKLIDPDDALFVYIPQGNTDFVQYAMVQMAGLTESDAKTIASRSKKIAISTDENADFQAAIEGSFPSIGIKYALSEKNGWIPSAAENTIIPLTYYSNEKYNIQVSSPVSANLMASKNLSSMLKRFDENQPDYIPETSENAAPAKVEFDYSKYLPGYNEEKEQAKKPLSNEEIYKFLTETKKNEIRFYSKEPSRLIKNFFGKFIKLGLVSMSGMLENSSADKTFEVTLNLDFTGPTVTKAAKLLIEKAIFPLPAKVQITGASRITIWDLSLTYKQLIRMITQ